MMNRGLLGRLYPRLWFFNKFVDEAYYFHRYPDVASAGFSAVDHYMEHGWKEGRNPSSDFHTLYYALKLLPGGELRSNPLIHFRKGYARKKTHASIVPSDARLWRELQKERVSFLFDEQFYTLKYADHLGGLAPLEHYFAAGWSEGFDPRADFATEGYVGAHEFILNCDVNPFFHFVMTRHLSSDTLLVPDRKQPAKVFSLAFEKVDYQRTDILHHVAKDFERNFYCERNPDVVKAGINPLVHYVDYGWKENRDPSPWFWTRYYLNQYRTQIPEGCNPLYHYNTIGKAKGLRPNPIGVEPWAPPAAPPDEFWDDVRPAADLEGSTVAVIMPVYKGYDDTFAAIKSVLSNPQETSFVLIVVNDRSPDPLITDQLRLLANKAKFYYVENEENLGFIGSVNKGLRLAAGKDVVLLNSDAIVYRNWLDRLIGHANLDENIATVTPYSNNASICSYPDVNTDNMLSLECAREDLDLYASRCNTGRNTVIPTGVGFCLYMRRTVIDEIGILDTAFGRGYGEENDFCVRAIKAGYKNVLAEDVFVYHHGQVSFKEFRGEEYESGQLVLLGKHPDYQRRIEMFVEADPGRESRLRLDLYRLARNLGSRTAVLVTMNARGGIETHLKLLAARLEEAGISVVMLYGDGDFVKVRTFNTDREVYTPSLASINIVANISLLDELLDWIDPAILHVHSFATLRWRATTLLMKALSARDGSFFLTLHDYDSICHRHHLIDREGRFCVSVISDVCGACVRADDDAIDKVAPATRIEAYRDFLASAKKVFVPSNDAKERLEIYFPDVRFDVRSHEETLPVCSFLKPRPASKTLRVVVIGAIGPHKGSDLVYSLALDAKLRDLPIKYSIIGYSAISEKMKSVGVVETGRYISPIECINTIEKLAPDFALFPSIWPETYCFTLSIAFLLGLPPLVLDLGAQAERVRRFDFGVILDRALASSPNCLNDTILGLSVEEEWAKRRPVAFTQYKDLEAEYYDRELTHC